MKRFFCAPRLRLAMGLGAVIALGLGSRYFPQGNRFWDLDLGDIVSGTAAYFLFAFIFLRAKITSKMGIAFIYCVAVEFFKLTGIPAQVRHIAPLRWLLGTNFSLHNLPLYALGILLGAVLDRLLLRLEV